MVQAVASPLPFAQSSVPSGAALSKSNSDTLSQQYNNSSPLSFQNSVLLAQAYKPVPAVAPLPVVKPSVKGRWIVDAKSGKKVLVSNLPDGRVRIEVAKGKAYYEIGTPDWDIQKRLADPTSMFAKHAAYRISAADVGKGVKTSKVAAKTTKQANSGVKPKVSVKNADTYNVDRSYTPPNMLPEDRFLGYAGVDIFDKKKTRFVRREVLVGVNKKGRGFYIVDRKGKKTTFPNATTDREAMEMGRMWVRSKLENPASTDVLPMVSNWAEKNPIKAPEVKDISEKPVDWGDILPDIYAVGAVFKMPKFVETVRDKLPKRLQSFLPRGQGIWALLPNGSNALTQPTFFSSTPFVPFNITPDKLNRLGLGSVFTYNTATGKLEGGVGGTARLALPGGNNMVFWINGRSNQLVIKPPAKGDFVRSVNIGVALGLAKPAANTLDFIAGRTMAVAAAEAAAGVVVPPAAPVAEGAAVATAGTAIVQKTFAGALHGLAKSGALDVYTGVGIRVEAKWKDGQFIGLFKGGHQITLAAVLKMMNVAQKETHSIAKKKDIAREYTRVID
jgi:hypothetical protein